MYQSLFCHCVSLLGSLISTSKTLRGFQDVKQGMHMEHVGLNPRLTYARLACPAHPNMTSLKLVGF